MTFLKFVCTAYIYTYGQRLQKALRVLPKVQRNQQVAINNKNNIAACYDILDLMQMATKRVRQHGGNGGWTQMGEENLFNQNNMFYILLQQVIKLTRQRLPCGNKISEFAKNCSQFYSSLWAVGLGYQLCWPTDFNIDGKAVSHFYLLLFI